MKLTNCYIFFDNPYRSQNNQPKDTNDNTIYIHIDSARLRLEKIFNLAETNNRDWYNHNYCFSVENCDVEMKIQEVSRAAYVTVSSSGKTKNIIIKSLEEIQKSITDSGIEKDYVMIVSYDAVSEFYCNKLYPKLNELERNLRKLLFNTYTLNFGMSYYRSTVNEDLQKKGKGVIKATGGAQKKEIENIKNFFYALDYSDIQSLLFVPQWTQVEENAKNDFLNKNLALNELTDEELRNAFNRISPKSDWERLFKSKMANDDVESLIDSIRKSRNSVAHCKFFYKDEYNQCRRSISKLNKEILAAIEITETEDFAKENYQNFIAGISRIKESLRDFAKSITPIVQMATQVMPAVLKDLSERISQIIKPFSSLSLLQLGENEREIKSLDDKRNNKDEVE